MAPQAARIIPAEAELNDPLEDLLGPNLPPRVLPSDEASVRMRAVVEAQQPDSFTEPCPKCGGSGLYDRGRVTQLGHAKCTKCMGRGRMVYSQPASVRLANRQKAAARKGRKIAKKVEAFKAANPGMQEYLAERAVRWPFAADMLANIGQYGSLSDRQRDVILNAMARDEERAAARVAERAQQEANATVVDTAGIDRLKAAFDKAIAYSAEKGLKLAPRITIGGMTIKPAKATSKNPGALYVTGAGDAYFGKIADGRFYASRECSPERAVQVQAFLADPAEAAKVYGQTTGTCCICNATLISKWKFKGIGPICAEKFGF